MDSACTAGCWIRISRVGHFDFNIAVVAHAEWFTMTCRIEILVICSFLFQKFVSDNANHDQFKCD